MCVDEDTEKLECLDLFNPTICKEEIKWWWADFASWRMDEHALGLCGIK
jgi:hypothetical protein